MATFVRNRVLHQMTWAPEDEIERAERREALCELDGLLAQLEQVNLKGGVIPPRVLMALRRRGVQLQPRVNAAELIEAIFGVQERFMRQPDGTAASEPLSMHLRGRLAS
jgi:hypothetical protein